MESAARAELIFFNNGREEAGTQWLHKFQSVNKHLAAGTNGPKLDPEPIVVDLRRQGISTYPLQPEQQPAHPSQAPGDPQGFHEGSRNLVQHFAQAHRVTAARPLPEVPDGALAETDVQKLRERLGLALQNQQNKEAEISCLVQEVSRLQNALAVSKRQLRDSQEVNTQAHRSKSDDSAMKHLQQENEMLKANNEILAAQNLAYSASKSSSQRETSSGLFGWSCACKQKDKEIAELRAEVAKLKTIQAQKPELSDAKKVARGLNDLLHEARMAYIEMEEFKMDKKNLLKELTQFRTALQARNQQIEQLNQQNQHLQKNLEKVMSQASHSSMMLQEKQNESKRLSQQLHDMHVRAQSYDGTGQNFPVMHVEPEKVGFFAQSTMQNGSYRDSFKRTSENYINPVFRRHSQLSEASTSSHHSQGSPGPASPMNLVGHGNQAILPGHLSHGNLNPNSPFLFV